jgi:hypothetical protein
MGIRNVSIGNPTNEWEQGMLDAWHTVWLDPIIEQAAIELGYVRPICSQYEQEKSHAQTLTRDNGKP